MDNNENTAIKAENYKTQIVEFKTKANILAASIFLFFVTAIINGILDIRNKLLTKEYIKATTDVFKELVVYLKNESNED